MLPITYGPDLAPEDFTTTTTEFFVNDFIGATNDLSSTNLLKTSRAMLHDIEYVYSPASITKHPDNDSIANKKLLKKEGLWDFEKKILGWLVNGANFTIQLPEDKCQKILTAKSSYSTISKNLQANFNMPPLAYQMEWISSHHSKWQW
eukprot:2162260-Ditylum_brightwellii.AAC.1